MTVKDIQPQTIRAHELYGDFWFNSEPVPICALRGQVILLEFWDYTCTGSQRTMPYLKEWQRKYEKYGLVVVGVHTPKFPFGRHPEEVQKAVHRLDIKFPVVMDNEHLIATQYDARVWPAVFLIDKNGFVRYQNDGEGNYSGTEHAIQTLLYDAGVGEELPFLMDSVRAEDKPGALCYRATPELYAGYLRGSIGNVEGYSPESVVTYVDPLVYIDGRFYAEGSWLNEKDSLRLVNDAGEVGHIILKYRATAVNGVLKAEGARGCELAVRQDDQYLNAGNKGHDVIVHADGRSTVLVGEPKSYSIVANREYGEHVLRLSIRAKGLSLFSFMFVSSVIPELISRN
jgi:thiol-disulfide isomerase/thioredoxin